MATVEDVTPSGSNKNDDNDNLQIDDTTKLLDEQEGENNKDDNEIPNGTSSLFITILNMIKLMIGSGMLSLPWALYVYSHSDFCLQIDIICEFCNI